MVKHAGNGLVRDGSANLRLMRILYWVFTLVLIAVGYGNMPLSMQFKPGFPENTVMGKICLNIDFIDSKESVKPRLLGFAFPFLWLMYGYLWPRRVYSYINGQNLNQNSFSAYGGKYRRNIFTYKETLSYNSYWCFFIILENTILIVMEVYSQHISKEARFIIHHLFCFIFIDIFHGLYLPLKHITSCRDHFSSQRQPHSVTHFYVRDPELVPRRDHTQYQISRSGSISVGSCSLRTDQRIRTMTRHRGQIVVHNLPIVYEDFCQMPLVVT